MLFDYWLLFPFCSLGCYKYGPYSGAKCPIMNCYTIESGKLQLCGVSYDSISIGLLYDPRGLLFLLGTF